VSETAGVPTVTIAPTLISFAESVSRLSPLGERWRAEGGMFDGCELDFEGTGADRRFFGGLYAFEFEPDETRVVTLPAEVDAAGELAGTWHGTLDSPIGAVPLIIAVDARNQVVTIAALGAEAADDQADALAGWIRARFELEIVGFGPITLFARLGLTGGVLEGLLYARTDDGGELCFPATLARDPQ
jgi:hypothetical protein